MANRNKPKKNQLCRFPKSVLQNSSAFSHFEFFLFRRKLFCILDRLGLNFNASNLKFLWIVANYVTYNLLKFQIDSIKIKALWWW